MPVFRTRVVSGLSAPDYLEREARALEPQIGHALLAGALSWLRAVAKAEIAKDPENAVDWLLVAELSSIIHDRLVRALPVGLLSLSSLPAARLTRWAYASALIGWALRETDIVRGRPRKMKIASPPPLGDRLRRRRPLVTRARLAALRALETQRRANCAEAKDNDAYDRLVDAVRKCRTKAQTTLADLEAFAWPSSAAFFQALPAAWQLSELACSLLRIAPEGFDNAQRLDAIESLFHHLLSEVRRARVARFVAGASQRAVARYMAKIEDAVAFGLSMSIPHESRDLQNELYYALRFKLPIDVKEVRSLSTETREEFERTSRIFARGVLRTAMNIHGLSASLKEVLAKLRGPFALEGEALINLLIGPIASRALQTKELAQPGAHNSRSLVRHWIGQRFQKPERWSVAFPLRNCFSDKDTSGTHLVRLGALKKRFGIQDDPNPVMLPLGDDAICICVQLRASSHDSAVALAKQRALQLLDSLWFFQQRNGPAAELEKKSLSFRHRDGDCHAHHLDWWPPWGLRDEAAVHAVDRSLAALARGWSLAEHNDLWDRLANAVSLYRSSAQAVAVGQKYRDLWFALEVLLGPPQKHDKKYQDRMGGTGRVIAYRGALIGGASIEFLGKTWIEARIAQGHELRTLYVLRNRAVHEGRLQQPFETAMFERLCNTIARIIGVVAGQAFHYALNVEDLIACLEHRFPARTKIED